MKFSSSYDDKHSKNVNKLKSFNQRGNEYKNRNLKCVYSNADSFINKLDEFKTRFMSDKPDIIMITEVLPKNSTFEIMKSEISLDGYDMFPENFPIKNSRGIVIYVKSELKAVEIDINQHFSEYCCIKINLKDNDKLLVVCVYRSPSSDIENYDLLNKLLKQISILEEESFSHILITGDFNFPAINWEKNVTRDTVSSSFLECIRDCYFEQVVDKPTRFRIGQEPSILDLIITNDSNNVQNINYQDPLKHSDHIVMTFEYVCYTQHSYTNNVKFNYKKAEFEKIREGMTLDWDELMENKYTNEMIDIFMTKLNSEMNKHIPKRKNSARKNSVPLSEEIRSLIRKSIEHGKST